MLPYIITALISLLTGAVGGWFLKSKNIVQHAAITAQGDLATLEANIKDHAVNLKNGLLNDIKNLLPKAPVAPPVTPPGNPPAPK